MQIDDNLDDDSRHIREVCAYFGAAIYSAQVLEHGLVNAMIYLDLIPNRGQSGRSKEDWAEVFDAFMDSHFEGTLGRMISNLKMVASVPPDLQGLLAQALNKRNWLAHAYFRERSLEFLTTQGRDRMIEELEKLDAFFRQVDRRLDEVMRPSRERYGFTDERLQKEYDAMLAEHGISE